MNFLGTIASFLLLGSLAAQGADGFVEVSTSFRFLEGQTQAHLFRWGDQFELRVQEERLPVTERLGAALKELTTSRGLGYEGWEILVDRYGYKNAKLFDFVVVERSAAGDTVVDLRAQFEIPVARITTEKVSSRLRDVSFLEGLPPEIDPNPLVVEGTDYIPRLVARRIPYFTPPRELTVLGEDLRVRGDGRLDHTSIIRLGDAQNIGRVSLPWATAAELLRALNSAKVDSVPVYVTSLAHISRRPLDIPELDNYALIDSPDGVVAEATPFRDIALPTSLQPFLVVTGIPAGSPLERLAFVLKTVRKRWNDFVVEEARQRAIRSNAKTEEMIAKLPKSKPVSQFRMILREAGEFCGDLLWLLGSFWRRGR